MCPGAVSVCLPFIVGVMPRQSLRVIAAQCLQVVQMLQPAQKGATLELQDSLLEVHAQPLNAGQQTWSRSNRQLGSMSKDGLKL